jgi:hypothetical protein
LAAALATNTDALNANTRALGGTPAAAGAGGGILGQAAGILKGIFDRPSAPRDSTAAPLSSGGVQIAPPPPPKFAAGGFTSGHGLFEAGERGTEFVLRHEATQALGSNFLNKLNSISSAQDAASIQRGDMQNMIAAQGNVSPVDIERVVMRVVDAMSNQQIRVLVADSDQAALEHANASDRNYLARVKRNKKVIARMIGR